MNAQNIFFLLSAATSSLHVIQIAMSDVVPSDDSDCQITPLSFDVDPMDNPQFLHTFFWS